MSTAVIGRPDVLGPMSVVILGVDLGKNSCRLVGLDAADVVVMRRSMRR
jgi:hypothetical protein